MSCPTNSGIHNPSAMTLTRAMFAMQSALGGQVSTEIVPCCTSTTLPSRLKKPLSPGTTASQPNAVPSS